MRSRILNIAAYGTQFALQVLHLFLAKSAKSDAGYDNYDEALEFAMANEGSDVYYCPPGTNAFFTGSAGAISIGITLL
jgi:hypothetical protein